MTEIIGSGVALLDYDNDGDLDVFLVQSRGQCTSSPAAGKDLCPEHARAWDRWKRAQAERERGGKA